MSNNNSEIKSVIEALLFVSEKPVLIEQIRSVFKELTSADIRNILDELKTDYLDLNRGMRVTEVAGGFQMVTNSDLIGYLKKFYRKAPERLSGPTLETLSIIAYKQPITRSEIEHIRGVDVSGTVKNLINKGLIRIAGRRKIPGRPFVYSTTRQFLEYFGLNSLDELPKIEQFKNNDTKNDIETEIEIANSESR